MSLKIVLQTSKITVAWMFVTLIVFSVWWWVVFFLFDIKDNICDLKSESVSHSVMSNSATPSTVAHQAPLSMGFPRQEYWSGLPFPPSGDLPHPWSNLGLLHCRQILCCLSYQRFQLQNFVLKHLIPDFRIISVCEASSYLKHLFLLHWLYQSLWLCGSQQTVENS